MMGESPNILSPVVRKLNNLIQDSRNFFFFIILKLYCITLLHEGCPIRKSELVLRGWLIERGIFIIIIACFSLV